MSLVTHQPAPHLGPLSEIEVLSPAGSKLLPFKPETDPGDRIYEALSDHQRSEDWRYRNFVAELHRWAAIFDRSFGLSVPEVSLGIGRLRAGRLGHFCPGHNLFGLKGEIVLNARYLLDARGSWEVLGTLLHELLHGWQQAHGKAGRHNYHNVQFRRKAFDCGLVVDDRGHTTYDPEGRFFDLLREHGVDLPELPPPVPRVRTSGGSKLKKWSCGCTNVRVAVERFHARCLHCGNEFLRCV
jgi:hypothetical protein